MEDRDHDLRLFARQLELLNRHLAVNKRDLESLLREERPRLALRDGSTHLIKREELERLRELVPEELRSQLHLPIYIELAAERYGEGTARIVGKAECFVVALILGREAQGDELFIYKPEVRVLRKALPTTTQYMFTLALE